MKEGYSHLKEVHSRFISKVDDWTELLETNEDCEPVYPLRDMPESKYNPDNEDLSRKTSQMEEVLISARDMLAQFIVSLPAPEQIYMVQEAMLPFLKNLDTIKAHFVAKSIGNAGDQEEEDDTNTVINGGDNGADEEVPQDEENNILNQGGDNYVPSPSRSPRNFIESSKSVRI